VEQYKKRGDLDKIDKHTNRVKSSVEHLTAILNDFLSLGKLEEGKVEVVKDTINLTILFQDIIEEIKASLKEGQNINLINKSMFENIVSDTRVLRNILFNLLSNASKYSEADKDIDLFVTTDNRILMIAVKDYGIGIPKEDHKHMFERFFRAGNVSNIQGTGLGLNIVKRYVELLDGQINFTSEDKKGSTFLVSIPL